MVLLKKLLKRIKTEIGEVYYEDPPIVGKKAIHILSVNIIIIAAITIFAIFVFEIAKLKYTQNGEVLINTVQFIIVPVLSVLSIMSVFKGNAKKAVYILSASMMSFLSADIIAVIMSAGNIQGKEFYDTMFLYSSIIIVTSFLAMSKKQLTIISAIALSVIALDYYVYFEFGEDRIDFVHMIFIVLEFAVFCGLAHMSFSAYEKSMSSIIKANNLSKQKYKSLFENMSDGFAYCEMMFDDHGEPVDAIILENNRSFEKILEIERKECGEKLLSNIMEKYSIQKDNWIPRFHSVAFKAREIKAERKLKGSEKCVFLHSFSPVRGSFVVMIRDITEVVESNELVKESEQLHRNLIENSPDSIILTDLYGKVIMASPSSSEIFGYERKNIIDMNIKGLIDSKEHGRFSKYFKEMTNGDSIGIMECAGKRSDGSIVSVEVNMKLIVGSRGRGVKALFFIRDSSERKKSERTFKKIFHSHSSMMYLMDIDKKRIVDANRSAVGFYGYQIVGMSIYEIAAEERNILDTNMKGVIRNGSMNFDERHIIANEDVRDMRVSMSMTNMGDKKYAFAILSDITEEKRAKSMLEKLSVTDPLTGIYNRLKFDRELEKEIAFSKQSDYEFSLIMIDIDYFKKVNDTYGHDVGDMVLKQLVQIVKCQVRDSDVFARWGGEEFIVMARMSNAKKARMLAERIRSSIEESDFDVVGKITCSLGVASCKGGDDEKSIAKRVDEALYTAKETGRNKVVVKL